MAVSNRSGSIKRLFRPGVSTVILFKRSEFINVAGTKKVTYVNKLETAVVNRYPVPRSDNTYPVIFRTEKEVLHKNGSCIYTL